MSILIDELVKRDIVKHTQEEIQGGWYIAKPLPCFNFFDIFRRIRDACRVLRGSAKAYHYKRDELNRYTDHVFKG